MGIAHLRTIVALSLLAACSAQAHEIGTMRISARFQRDHTYVIDVATSQDSLTRRHATPAMLAEAIEVRFSNARVNPRITMLPGPVIRLQGKIPPRASAFTWRYGMTFAAYALTAVNEGDAPQTQWVSADEVSKPFPLSHAVITPTRLDVIRQYLVLGFTHIVPKGFDHILFVLGLFLLSTRLKDVLAQVSAFTIAHSITLGLTIYGVVSLPPRIVEPMIALSIAYVAIENIFTTKLHGWRVAVVFCFGLLHGMGFAGVLKELGLPRSQFLTALVAFNVGVEAGQLSVIAAAFLLFAYWHQHKTWFRYRFLVPASLVIAMTGIFWTFQRILT